MNDNVFRKKSLDRLQSVDQLNDYIKVSNPSVWLVISAVCVLLVSLFVWSVRGNITTSVDSTGTFLDTNTVDGADIVVCCVTDEQAQKISRALAKDENGELEVRIYNKYESTNNYVVATVENMSTKSYKKEVISKEFGMTGHAADTIMPNAGAYYAPVILKLTKDPNSKDGFKWAKNETGDATLVAEDGLCRVEIITESISPISFLVGKDA